MTFTTYTGVPSFGRNGGVDAVFGCTAHPWREEFFKLTGQFAQPNQDSGIPLAIFLVFSKRAAFFNGLENKVGHIMARASALRQPQPPTFCPLSPSPPCPQLACPDIRSTPLISPTTSFLPALAHERATSSLFRASAFAFRSFTLFTRIPSGNKQDSASCLHVQAWVPNYACMPLQ